MAKSETEPEFQHMHIPLTVGLAAIALSACVTSREADQDAAYAKCAEIADRGVRQTCYTRAIEDAQKDRLAEDAREAEDAAERERDAAVNEAYGVPDEYTRDN
jgi:hypothetical protein